MKLGGLLLGPISGDDLTQLRSSEPTYDHVGSTLDPDWKASERHYERRATVGAGLKDFEAARSALLAWRPQRSLGASITPCGVKPDSGKTVVIGLGLGGLRLNVPNRIVAVIDEANRFGYAYGTLPGHPERGEELFLLEQEHDGSVVMTIRVDAEPARGLAKVDFIVRPLQRVAIHRYLSAVAKSVGSSGEP